MRLLLLVLLPLLCANLSPIKAAQSSGDRVVAIVNGSPILQREVDRLIGSQPVPASRRQELRESMLQKLIDERLVAAELKRLKVKADPQTLDKSVKFFMDNIRKSGNDPKKVLHDIGHTRDSFRAEFALKLAWRRYAYGPNGVITVAEVKSLFHKERARYDGTKLRARQIVLKLPPKADAQAKQRLIGRMTAIRRGIAAGKTTFEAAAKFHSTSPSKDKGGDIGFFGYGSIRLSGKLSRAAFALKGKEISQPIVTRTGVHILQVTDRKPGQLSLEDVRGEILKRLSAERWKSKAKELRASAKIELK